jgi:hypothetical protein
MSKKRGVLVIAAVAGSLSGVASQAQVATGPWTQYSPSYSVQQKGCGVVSGSTFSLNCSDTSGEQRAERRYSNYSSKTRQFEGYLKVSSLGGSRICVKQTFKNNPGGPWFLLAVEHGGRLYNVEGGETIGSTCIGCSTRVNTVHYLGSAKVVVYLNGSQKFTLYGGEGSEWYDKFGAYRTASGYGPATVNWSSVRFWYK